MFHSKFVFFFFLKKTVVTCHLIRVSFLSNKRHIFSSSEYEAWLKHKEPHVLFWGRNWLYLMLLWHLINCHFFSLLAVTNIWNILQIFLFVITSCPSTNFNTEICICDSYWRQCQSGNNSKNIHSRVCCGLVSQRHTVFEHGRIRLFLKFTDWKYQYA